MFVTPIDIANRALQLLGSPRITAFTDSSKQAAEAYFCYDKIRRSELTKAVWNCAVRRCVMRKIVLGSTVNLTFASWSTGTTYGLGDVVKDTNSVFWLSNVASNLNNTPGIGGINPPWSLYAGPLVAQAWSSSVTYIPGDVVWVSTTAYICSAVTTNNTPPNTTYWQPMTATLVTILRLAPIGYPKDGGTIRNLYRLPSNFLRIAPMDPKVAGNVRSNTTAGTPWNDYEFETGFMTSAVQGSTQQADPLVMRFVADQADVPTMDDTLCEAIAARMAIEMAETLTQSKQKKMDAVALYDNAVAIAKMVNAIESGTTEPEPNTPIPGASMGGQSQGQGG